MLRAMSIEALAHELIGHQEKSKRLLESGNIDAWLDELSQELRLVEQLRARLLNHSIVVTDDPAVKQVLNGIDLTEIENFDKVGSELLYSWISPAEYGARFAEVNVLFAPFQIPFELRCFLDEARKCYALGQFSAVQSLSRTILEAAVNEIGIRAGKIPQEAVEKDMFKEYPPKERIRLVAGDRFEQIYQHYRDLCKVVHGLSTSATSGALGSLTKTIGFVQYLYEQHKVPIKSRNA
ncbi:MAG: hypothetical protein DME22_17100 [Verrucomicrobia bacterium]|nr:MAG: hypothetical protein DME22_17100 [Verrucomicrobiota bacterium]PYJ96688.1 MAG: hypothetical protein DME23_19410 [Verrucomicrobiota bacterium]